MSRKRMASKDKVHGSPWGHFLVQKVPELETDRRYLVLKKMGKRHNFDYPHSAQVCSLSLALFDDLAGIHGLGEKERDLLMASSLLHDIGAHSKKAKTPRASPGHEHPHHHKRSQRIILNEGIPGLNREETEVVACVARYHTSSVPHKDHPHYCDLEHRRRKVVRRLASLLRIADSLDRRHALMVRDLRCHIPKDRGTMTIWVFCKKHEFDWRPKHRTALFEKEFGMRVRIHVLFGTSVG